MVQGSKQEFADITFEQRTEYDIFIVGCAGYARYSENER